MTVNNSLRNEKIVGGLPRIGRFLLRNLACSALVPGPAAGHQCSTSLSPLSDSFPAKWLSTQKTLLMVGVARFVIPKEFICILFQVTKTEHYLKFVTVVAPSSPVSLAVLSVRTRTSALGILACATAQVMCHPPARHWMSGDLFDIRGAVYVEHDGHAKTLDGSSSLRTHCPFFNNFHPEVDGRIRFIFR